MSFCVLSLVVRDLPGPIFETHFESYFEIDFVLLFDFGPVFGPFGVLLGHFWGPWGVFWVLLGSFEGSCGLVWGVWWSGGASREPRGGLGAS